MAPTVRDRVAAQRSTLLKRIATAAGAADTGRLLDLTGQLQRLEHWVTRHDSLLADAEAILGGGQEGPSPQLPPGDDHQAEQRANGHQLTASGRSYGSVIRANFVRAAATKGLALSSFRGAVYRTPRGTRVGIAVATERNPNRWFLGLGIDEFDSAVLLCHTTGGRTLEICLPQSFFCSHGPRLSRSGGQVKFNVTRRDSHLYLTIPSTGKVSIDQYVGAVSGLG